MHRRRRLILLGISLALAACGTSITTPTGQEDSVRYVALGDSYTIGTSVGEADRWPNQLVARIASLELVANPAVNGYTSKDLIDDELPQVQALQPELVTVQIGVNDVVQGVPEGRYATNVETILDELLVLLPAERVVCVATPDYTVTPQGAAFGDPAQQRAGIVQVNAILRDACESRSMRFVPDIFEISQDAASEGSLVAGDGLHPSGAQYARWVDAIAPVVNEVLGTGPATLQGE
ncbi:MAG: SGNH/GDSL hydrolase family protein [Candidatus Limnocylindria bacterium]